MFFCQYFCLCIACIGRRVCRMLFCKKGKIKGGAKNFDARAYHNKIYKYFLGKSISPTARVCLCVCVQTYRKICTVSYIETRSSSVHNKFSITNNAQAKHVCVYFRHTYAHTYTKGMNFKSLTNTFFGAK